MLRADSRYCPRGAALLPCHDNSTTRWAWRPPRRCASISSSWRRAPPARATTDGRRETAPVQGILRRSRKLGPRRAHHRTEWRRGAGPIRASLSPASPICQAGRSTRTSTVRVDRRRTTSRRGRRIGMDAHVLRTRDRQSNAAVLHVGAYWLMWSLRTLMPRRSRWRVAQFDTLRLRHFIESFFCWCHRGAADAGSPAPAENDRRIRRSSRCC